MLFSHKCKYLLPTDADVFYPEIKNNLACLDLTEEKYPAAIAKLEEALKLLAKMVLFDKRLEGTLKTNLDKAKTANSDVKPDQFFFRYLTIKVKRTTI